MLIIFEGLDDTILEKQIEIFSAKIKRENLYDLKYIKDSDSLFFKNIQNIQSYDWSLFNLYTDLLIDSVNVNKCIFDNHTINILKCFFPRTLANEGDFFEENYFKVKQEILNNILSISGLKKVIFYVDSKPEDVIKNIDNEYLYDGLLQSLNKLSKDYKEVLNLISKDFKVFKFDGSLNIKDLSNKIFSEYLKGL